MPKVNSINTAAETLAALIHADPAALQPERRTQRNKTNLSGLSIPNKDPLFKSLRKFSITARERRFLYYFLVTLDSEEAAEKSGLGYGHARHILHEMTRRADFQELMGMVGLDDLTLLGKLSQLVHAKKPALGPGGKVVMLDAPEIQVKALEITAKSKGWFSDGARNVNVFAAVPVERTRAELEILE